MTSVADRLQRKTTSRQPSSKQVRLKLVYVDFWSAVKLSFLVAVCLGVALVVAVFMIWIVLQSTGVFGQLGSLATDIIGASFDLMDYVGLGQVMVFTVIIALLNVVVITALGAIVALLYNLSVRVTGGLLVGFTNS
jgi:hypothetical protein